MIFAFQDKSILLAKSADGKFSLPKDIDEATRLLPNASLRHETLNAYTILPNTETAAANPSAAIMPLRQACQHLCEEQYAQAAKSFELVHFARTAAYCGQCGGKMEWHSEISRRCCRCHTELWPQITPAIIVLVSRGNDILLVRPNNPHAGNRTYGLVSGFIETGESAETAVRREVREETGIEIRDIKYLYTRYWPYPSNLMIAYRAEYVSGEIRLQQSELRQGGFFSPADLPALPPAPSVAREMIETFISELAQ